MTENQTGLSPTSPSCPRDYADLKDSLIQHFQMVGESLADTVIAMDDTPIPTSPIEPCDWILIRKIDCCQQNLTWSHLSDDTWTSVIEQWLDGTVEQAVDVPLYSPSVYSQGPITCSPRTTRPLGTTAWDPMQETPRSPRQNITMDDLLDLIEEHIADLCATISGAEDSAESDASDSNTSSSSNGESEHNSTGTSEHNNNGTSQRNDILYRLGQLSNQRNRSISSQSSTQSYVRVRAHPCHHVSPNIFNWMAHLENSGFTI